MLHSLTSSGNPTGNVTDASMLERRRAQTKWQQEQLQQQQRYLEETDLGAVFSGPQFQGFAGGEAGFSGFVNHSSKVVPGLDNGWPELGNFAGGGGPVGCGFGINSGISRTTSYPPVVEASTPAVAEAKQILSVLTEKTSSSGGREGSKKRKADKNQNIKAIAEEDAKQKRVKECPEAGESKTEQNSNSSKSNTRAVGPGAAKREVSGKASKENSRVTEVKKPDYIHVRARRGQATDSHSLAERVRREKISERMKFLQELVPGCSKITGKAGMLDEIINYVQSLQRQVEFLSMKLAAVDPTLDFNIDDILVKEVFPACQSNFPLKCLQK
ncbi:unnamed protein product [Thlaspi arvense]|uniref:BHLH domain-containing protein n=1 Tax=Thlaspi arvense TaxID=13288 RepID=A0AAU9RJX5_THLAR|nr:unnamed protein product [Thlaspi arvense]